MKDLRKLVEESLKTNKIRMHQNGFYQLDLILGTRLHIWPNEKQEHQKYYQPVHDHSFSFRSLILLGHLIHKEYEFLENEHGKYQMYRAVPRDNYQSENTVIKPTGKFGNLINVRTIDLYPGYEYTFEKHKLHESVNEEGVLTATLMKKTSFDENYKPMIIGVKEYDPEDNEFDRLKINQEKAFYYLNEVLNNLSIAILNTVDHFLNNYV